MESGLTPIGRVFAAVVPPTEVVVALDAAVSGLALPGRRVPPPNWHITLRFVGHVDAVTYERWLGALSRIPPFSVEVRLHGLGAFPNPRRATVLWAGVQTAELADLAAQVEEAAQSAGIAPEERPFRPHLTLARVRPPADARALVDQTELPRVAWRSEEFQVMAAVGSRYQRYESFP